MKKVLLLIVLVAIALGLRLYNLDARGLVTDEKFTLVNANGFWVGGANQSAFKKEYFTAKDFWEDKNIKDYFNATAHADFGTHIFHNAFLHYWMKAFGNSDFSVRLPSVIFNVLNVVLVFLMVYKYFRNYTLAFLAALLLALDPLNVAQSHIARSYPLSFLLITLSTEFFIRIIRGSGNKKNFIIYAVLVGMSLLNHYINFFIPLAHAIIFLFLRNKSHLWRGFILAAVFNAGLLFYWFNWGGGYTALGFLEDKNKIHTQIAQNADDELSLTIQKATPEIIIKKAIQLYYDIGVVGHGLFEKVKGVKIFLSSLIVALLLLFSIRFRGRILVKYSLLTLALVIIVLQSSYFLGILISASLFLAVFYGVDQLKDSYYNESLKGEFVLLSIGFLMLTMPVLFVINDAFTSGNTTSLTHRYIGNASPFVVIFIAAGIMRAIDINKWFACLFILVFIVQFGSIKNAWNDYFSDRSLYNAYFVPERVKNPYIEAANIIKSIATEEDTLIIPGAYKDKYQERFNKDMEISYKDAQFLNLYFDRDFSLIQHVDKAEREKMYLQKKNGEKVLIFDFKGEEFRY